MSVESSVPQGGISRSAPRGAVFLSYASQDAEAARHIAESLRSGGVEVWFDVEGGLEHGDEWDAKIRRQIKECVLFIPLISANIQARHEGYFRIEWDLAAERARGIASGVAFILPVVIDDTREPDALVPDRFRAVQWTKVPDGKVPPAVLERFLKLWSHRIGVISHQATQTVVASVVAQAAPTPSKRRPVWLVPALVGVLAIAALAIWRPWQSSESDRPARPELANGERVESAEQATPSLSEARQLVAQAWEQMNRLDMARAELQTADELCRRASVLDPTDPEVWAAWSFVDAWYCYHALDNTPERREGARSKAARALNLAPASYEARLAQANYLVREGSDAAVSLYAPEADRLLRALLEERPTEPRTLLTFAILQRNLGHAAEARLALETMAKDPAFAALAWHELAWVELRNGDPTTALELENRSIALQPAWLNLTGKMDLMMEWQGDLNAAKVVLDQIPAVAMQEDYTVAVALRLLHNRRTPDALLRLADSIPRDWLQSNMYRGPLGWWKGLAEQQAGRPAAARVHWQAAMKLVERRLADAPSSPELIAWKSRLLAVLGETTEAEKTLQLAREIGGVAFALDRWSDEVRLGQFEQALDEMESEYETNPGDTWAATLRHSPEFDPLREHPRFIALLDKMEADPRCCPNADNPESRIPNPESRISQPGSAPGAPDKSIAVLAFANLSDDKGNEYFSDGISEELLNVLSKIEGLKVSARTSSFHFKGKDTPIPEIAQQLGVAFVIEGSVRKSGNRVRITAQLIKAADGFHVWSDTFTRELEDIFAVQDEIAGLIAGQLQLTLGASTGTRAVVNPEAYRLSLEAHHFWLQRTDADLLRAETLYQQALDIAPDFARAHAGLAGVWMIRDWYRRVSGAPSDPDDHARSKAAAERAISLDPNLAEPYAILGVLRFNEGNKAEAAQAFQTALRLNPNYSFGHHWYSHLLMASGQLDDALAEMNRAVQLDPLSFVTLLISSMWHGFAGRYEEALALSDRAVEFGPEFFVPLLAERAQALQAVGRTGEAVALARQVARDLDMQPRWWSDPSAIHVLRQAGFEREAADYAERLQAAMPADNKLRSFVSVALGQNEEALAQLSRLGAPSSEMGALFYSPLWDDVREDPRFLQILTGLGLRDAHETGRATRARLSAEQEEE